MNQQEPEHCKNEMCYCILRSFYYSYTPFNENESSGSGEKFGFAVINVIIFLGIVIVMTVVLVILFKYRCYKVSHLYNLIYLYNATS